MEPKNFTLDDAQLSKNMNKYPQQGVDIVITENEFVLHLSFLKEKFGSSLGFALLVCLLS
jgi:hypothetical protein